MAEEAKRSFPNEAGQQTVLSLLTRILRRLDLIEASLRRLDQKTEEKKKS